MKILMPWHPDGELVIPLEVCTSQAMAGYLDTAAQNLDYFARPVDLLCDIARDWADFTKSLSEATYILPEPQVTNDSMSGC